MTAAHLVPLVMAPLLAWRFHRRFRRIVGRQPFRPARTTFSVVIMPLALCFIALSVLHLGAPLWSLLGGLAAGIGVAIAGCKLTTFEVTHGEKFYTPNAYLGSAITILLVLRIAYRLFVVYTSDGRMPATSPAIGQSPLTLFVLGLTLGYYLAFNAFILFRFSRYSSPIFPS